MKKFLVLTVLGFLSASISLPALDIGYVNLRECVDKSFLGKKEKENLEKLKNQFSDKITQIEKELDVLTKKLQDEDYLESLSDSAINELKTNFEQLNQEYNAYHSQYYQVINQANYQLIQIVLEEIKEASNQVRKDLDLDVILNEEAIFSIDPKSDVTEKVIFLMNQKTKSKLK